MAGLQPETTSVRVRGQLWITLSGHVSENAAGGTVSVDVGGHPSMPTMRHDHGMPGEG